MKWLSSDQIILLFYCKFESFLSTLWFGFLRTNSRVTLSNINHIENEVFKLGHSRKLKQNKMNWSTVNEENRKNCKTFHPRLLQDASKLRMRTTKMCVDGAVCLPLTQVRMPTLHGKLPEWHTKLNILTKRCRNERTIDWNLSNSRKTAKEKISCFSCLSSYCALPFVAKPLLSKAQMAPTVPFSFMSSECLFNLLTVQIVNIVSLEGILVSKMSSVNEEFIGRCLSDFQRLPQATDEDRMHILRRFTTQFQSEVENSEIPVTIRSTNLSQNLLDYSSSSTTALAKKFDEFKRNNGVELDQKMSRKCMLKESDVDLSNECQRYGKNCRRRELNQSEIDKLFDSDLNRLNLHDFGRRNEAGTSGKCLDSQLIDDEMDEKEDKIVFNLPLSRIRDLSQESKEKSFELARNDNRRYENLARTEENDFSNYSRSSHSERNDFADTSNRRKRWLENPTMNEGSVEPPKKYAFATANDELVSRYEKKFGHGTANQTAKKTLGGRRTVTSNFVSPFAQQSKSNEDDAKELPEVDERLKHIEPRMIELIRSEIMDHQTEVCEFVDILVIFISRKLNLLLIF